MSISQYQYERLEWLLENKETTLVTELDAIIVPTIRSPHNDPTHHATILADTLRASLLSIRDKTIADARNQGLTAARALGWRRIMFLDDDIGIRPLQVLNAAGMLPDCQIAAFRPVDFPDNSVVRHAARAAGMPTAVHPSGSAMLVNMRAVPAERRFINVYNEDWLFMHGLDVRDAGEVTQRAYDPFTPGRAAREEWGDLIAEATLGIEISAEAEFWEQAIRQRETFLRDVSRRLEAGTPAAASVREAQRALEGITPADVIQFLAEWGFCD